MGRSGRLAGQLTPVIVNKVREPQKPSQRLICFELRNVRGPAMTGLIAPVIEQIGKAVKRPCEPIWHSSKYYISNPRSPSGSAVFLENPVLVAGLLDCYRKQDGLRCGTAHRTACQVGARDTAPDRLLSSLMEARSEPVSKSF